MTNTERADAPSFNLWRDPWIRVTRLNGEHLELGIGACLAQAQTLYALHDPSPLVVAGIQRLLTAIVQAIAMPYGLSEIAALLDVGAFEADRITAFAAQYEERFELFHPSAPFLQTGEVPLDGWRKPVKDDPRRASWVEPKPVAPLFAELPSATYRAHFHHTTDESHRVCPACCARGLVTIPAFASSGGAGIYPSINGVPPIYVLPAGTTLYQTLVLSLAVPDNQPRAAASARAFEACWTGDAIIRRDGELHTIGYLEGLTFLARRVRLYPQREQTWCTQCGNAAEVVVRSMLYEMGHRRSSATTIWDDPFVAFRRPASKKTDVVAVRPQEGKALWREYTSLLLTRVDDPELRPKIVRQIGDLIDLGGLDATHFVRFRCIGLRTDGKGKFFEWFDEALDAPPQLLNDDDGALVVDTALQRGSDAAKELLRIFHRHFRPQRTEKEKRPSDKTARFKTLARQLEADFWGELAASFLELTGRAADPAAREQAARAWVQEVRRVGRRVFARAAEQAGTGAEQLRARVRAQHACDGMFVVKRKEWLGE